MIKTQTADKFLEIIKERRSYYAINNEAIVADERIEEIVATAIKHSPSAFNSQSGRVIVLLNDEHNKFWDLTEAQLKKVTPTDRFPITQEKMASFRKGYGTVLFFEDQATVKDLQTNFPLYKDKFPMYSQHASGILQFIVWTALEQEGFGASLQHYQPLVDEDVQITWNVPENWQLVAQMPFGKPTAAPNEKQFKAIEERMKFFK